MKRYILAVFIMLLLALLLAPSGAGQNTEQTTSDLLLRVSGPARVNAGDSIGTLLVIGNSARVDGFVQELVVINGNAVVNGTVAGNMTVVKGAAELGPSARVGKDVLLYRSTLNAITGSRVAGVVHNETGVSFGARALWLVWLSITIAIIGAGIVFAYFAGEPLNKVADGIGTEWSGTILTSLAIVFGLPAAAIVSFMTGIGVVFGFFLMFVVIPMTALIGYVIVGTSVGRAILGYRGQPSTRTYVAIATGILMIQALAAIPVIGGIVVLASSQLGAGALVFRRWKRDHASRAAPSLIIQPA